MLHALRLAEIVAGDAPAGVYVRMSESTVYPPVVAPDDEGGVAELLAQTLAEGETLVCEPALARAARALVLGTAPRPAWAAMPCAELATMFYLGRALERDAVDAILPAVAAACRLQAASPWRRFADAQALDVVATRAGGPRTFEGCVLGAGGDQFGVALHDRPGTLAWMAAEHAAGHRVDPRRLDVLILALEPHPAWVADAVRAAFDVPVVISPVRHWRGGLRALTRADLLTLAAACLAIVELGDDRDEATATAGEGADAVSVVARVRPADAPVPAAAPRTPRRPANPRRHRSR